MTNKNWKIERDQVPPRVFGRGAMMKHNIPLHELRPPRINDDGETLRDSLVLEMEYNGEAEEKIGRIRAFVQRHVNKIKKNVTDDSVHGVPKYSVMYGDNKDSIVIWRTH